MYISAAFRVLERPVHPCRKLKVRGAWLKRNKNRHSDILVQLAISRAATQSSICWYYVWINFLSARRSRWAHLCASSWWIKWSKLQDLVETFEWIGATSCPHVEIQLTRPLRRRMPNGIDTWNLVSTCTEEYDMDPKLWQHLGRMAGARKVRHLESDLRYTSHAPGFLCSDATCHLIEIDMISTTAWRPKRRPHAPWVFCTSGKRCLAHLSTITRLTTV